MEIFFSEIPDEGLPLSGDLPSSYFDLSENDSIRITGPISYDLTLYAFDEVLVMSGEVSGGFELQCVTCLDFFPHSVAFPRWQSEVEIEEGEVSFDPRESLRDEILLALPHSPHCDELTERECPKACLLEDLEQREEVELVEDEPGDSENVWDALDQLKK